MATSTALSAPAETLLGSDAVAHVWTENHDGSPQVSVVWVIVQDDEIVFGCDRSSQKAINLRRSPSIVISIEDDVRNDQGFQRHLVIRGQASIEDRPDPMLMDRLAKKYVGLEPSSAGNSGLAVVGGRTGVDRPDQRRRPLGRLM